MWYKLAILRTYQSFFFSSELDFITRNCEFKSHNSEKKVRIARNSQLRQNKFRITRCKLAIARKKSQNCEIKSCNYHFYFLFSAWQKRASIQQIERTMVEIYTCNCTEIFCFRCFIHAKSCTRLHHKQKLTYKACQLHELNIMLIVFLSGHSRLTVSAGSKPSVGELSSICCFQKDQ